MGESGNGLVMGKGKEGKGRAGDEKERKKERRELGRGGGDSG